MCSKVSGQSVSEGDQMLTLWVERATLRQVC